jgi:hypothetical protein
MIDHFETRVGLELQRLALPAASDALRSRIHEVPVLNPRVRGRRNERHHRSILIAAAAALVVAVGGGALLLSGGNPFLPSDTPAVTTSPSPTPLGQASLPSTVDGRPVLTISEAIAKRDSGDLGPNAVAIRGYWSDASVAHSCQAPKGQPGVLEIYCHEREFGITELDEPIEVVSEHGFTAEGSGPWLTPYVNEGVAGVNALFSLPVINGQRFPPVPIVVVGHFDDPRTADCRPEAKQLCRDRLVIDRIVVFERNAVSTPAPTPSPTLFPFADPPPAPYAVGDCTGRHPIKFAGWATLASLGLDVAKPDEIAYIVIAKDPIPIGDWFDDPNDGTRYRLWGQRVCYAYEYDPGRIGFTAIPGTLSREYQDGRREPTQGP